MARLPRTTIQPGIPAVGFCRNASGSAAGRVFLDARGGAPARGFAENPSLGLEGGWGMTISPTRRSGSEHGRAMNRKGSPAAIFFPGYTNLGKNQPNLTP